MQLFDTCFIPYRLAIFRVFDDDDNFCHDYLLVVSPSWTDQLTKQAVYQLAEQTVQYSWKRIWRKKKHRNDAGKGKKCLGKLGITVRHCLQRVGRSMCQRKILHSIYIFFRCRV
jgi:hypothetical protein